MEASTKGIADSSAACTVAHVLTPVSWRSSARSAAPTASAWSTKTFHVKPTAGYTLHRQVFYAQMAYKGSPEEESMSRMLWIRMGPQKTMPSSPVATNVHTIPKYLSI